MNDAINFALEVVKDLSSLGSCKPNLYQRDGFFYVVSDVGFAQIACGLRTGSEGIEPWQKREQLEIKESTDAVLERKGRPVFLETEKPYITAIAPNPDRSFFTLEEIATAAQQLAKLPDDGKVRMIASGSHYRSHKHGYGGDGVDVWVQEARVMEKGKYLELIGAKVDGLIQAIEQAGLDERAETRSPVDKYKGLKIPDVVVMTPYVVVSLLREGRVSPYHSGQRDSWTPGTEITFKSGWDYASTGSVLQYPDLNTFKESPFGVHIKLNAQNFPASTGTEVLNRIRKEYDILTSNLPLAEDFVARMNAAHNQLCASDIKDRKKRRRELQEEREAGVAAQ